MASSIRVFLVKSFTKNAKQGNPAGVVLNSETLSEKQRQFIAAQLGFSETAFVTDMRSAGWLRRIKNLGADFRVRFFTPIKEVPLCGHATIAAFHVLMSLGKLNFQRPEVAVATQKTNSRPWPLPVECHRDGRIVMTMPKPKFYPPHHDKEQVATLLKITPSEIRDDLTMQVVGGKLFVPMKSLNSLRAIQPDLNGIKDYCRHTEARGFYPFTQETIEDGLDFHARQFNPLAGVNEDPVTGVAAGAMGAYVKRYGFLAKRHIIVEQGDIVGKAGRVYVDFADQIKVGGYAVTFGEKVVELK